MRKSLDSTAGVFGYLFLCLNALVFSSLLAADPLTFRALTREDSWVENLTVVWFLLAGFLLFGTAWKERSFFRRCVYILVGVAMVFAAGEEISWGQRIFGFATPDFLMSLNESKEFNVHNITNDMFGIIYLNGTLILCMATSAAFLCGKDKLIGIPLPSILLMLGFLMVISYEAGVVLGELSGANFNEYAKSIRRAFGFIVVEEKGLLLLLFIFALFSRQIELVIASAATLALVLALTYVNYHGNVSIGHHVRGSLFEGREYLFGLGCLFYSLELLLAQERFAAISRAPFTGLKLPGGRIPSWLMTCSLVIAGSIGLMFFQYFNAMSRTAALYESIASGEPAARSVFDVYTSENTVAYLKSPCSAADVQAEFFLHVVPEDLEDLPADRRQYGFGGANFRYGEYAAPAFGGRCIMEHPLPDYPIARIRTGQFTPEGDQIWMAEFPVSAVRGASALPSPPAPGAPGAGERK